MLKPGDFIERYVIDAPIGEGGLAKVYRVHHADLGSVHALKVLQQTGERFKQRMLEEGRIQVRLRHPNVVAVTDMVRFHDSPCLVMEYVRGIPLDLYLDDVGPLPLDQLDRIVDDMLRGLGAAHAQRMIHRDLKPSNVMLSLQPDGVYAKVADFGLGKVLADGGLETRTNVSLGTPAYMAPEQIRDAKNVDLRADVYAVAALIYELLTGERAFPQNDLIERYHSSRDESWTPTESLRADVPARMHQAIRQALAYDVNKRPPDAMQMLDIWHGGIDVALAPRAQVLGDNVRATVERLRSEHQQETGVGAPPRVFQAPGSETAPSLSNPTPPEFSRVPEPTGPGATTSRRYAPPPPPPSNLPWVVVGVAVVSFALVFTVGAMLVMSNEEEPALETAAKVAEAVQEGPEDPPTTEPEPDAEPPGDATIVEPEPEPEPEPVEVAEVPATPPVQTRSEPSTSSRAPRQASTPAPPAKTEPSMGSVSVSGATKAVLVGADGSSVDPGKVPAGKYMVRVWFGEGDPVDAFKLEVGNGGSHEVYCDDLLFMCRER